MEAPRTIEPILAELDAQFTHFVLRTENLSNLQQILIKGWVENFEGDPQYEKFKPYSTHPDPMTRALFKLFLLRKLFTLFKQTPLHFADGINWFDSTRRILTEEFDNAVKNANPPYTYYSAQIRSLQDLQRTTAQESNYPPFENGLIAALGTELMLTALLFILKGRIDENIRGPLHGLLVLLIAATMAGYFFREKPRQLSAPQLANNRLANATLSISDAEVYKLQTIAGKARAIQARLPDLAKSKYRIQTDTASVNNFKLIIEKDWHESLDAKTALAEFKPGNDGLEHFLIRAALLKLMVQVYIEKKNETGKINMDGKWFVDQKAALLAELAKKPPLTTHNRAIVLAEILPATQLIDFCAKKIGASFLALFGYVAGLMYGYGTYFNYITPLSVRAMHRFYPSAEQRELNRWQELLRFSRTPEFQDNILPSTEELKILCPRAFSSAAELVRR